MKHNNVIPNVHFHKHWQKYVKTWFDQPARKQRRRIARQKKSVKIFPRPSDLLRPIVRCQTLKYNMRARKGRGFSLEELKAAGIPKKLAPTIGIAVDHRRRNRSVEGFETNVKRLRAYREKLLIFPRKPGKFKNGDSTAEELASAVPFRGDLLPLTHEQPEVNFVDIQDFPASNAYQKLRLEQASKRHHGARLKRAAEEEKESKK